MKTLKQVATLAATLFIAMPAVATGPGTGLLDSAAKAPISPDGNVSGNASDIVINLDISQHPSQPGLTLYAGDTVTVTLPDDFTAPGIPNIQSPFTGACVPPVWACSTTILLQGWPQHPLGVPPPFEWSVAQGASANQFVITALEDLIPNPPLNPGLKQIHLLLNHHVNPNPGHYTVHVATSRGESGSVPVKILPKTNPSIEVTSILFGAPGNPNTIFQQTQVNQPTPLPYDFLLWQRGGEPAIDVEIVDGRLVQGQKTVGQVRIEAPDGAVGQSIIAVGPSYPIIFPLSAREAGHMRAWFTAGSMPGTYRIYLKMLGGNSVVMQVDVP